MSTDWGNLEDVIIVKLTSKELPTKDQARRIFFSLMTFNNYFKQNMLAVDLFLKR